MDSFCEHLPLLVPAGQNVGKEIRYFVGVHRIEEAGGHDGGDEANGDCDRHFLL